MSELVLQGAMILVGGSIVLAGIVIGAIIMGYIVPFGGAILLICASLIIIGVYTVNKSAGCTSAGDK